MVAVFLLVFALFTLTGIYVLPPKNAPPSGATVWYYRRGSGLPFLSSPDAQWEKIQASPGNPFIPLAPRSDWIIVRFPYSRALYLRTTGGVEFIK